MRVTNERAQSALKAHHITGILTNIVKDYAADLLEAREIIKEMRGELLKISQYPIAFVCEEARTSAMEAWKKSKEYAE